MALYGWTGDNGDPDNFLDVLLGCTAARIGGNNIAQMVRPRLRRARHRREAHHRPGRRATSSTGEAQVIFHDEAPWVPLAHSVVFMATRANVTGFKMDPLGRHAFEGVDLLE